jgi:hypothetical protein
MTPALCEKVQVAPLVKVPLMVKVLAVVTEVDEHDVVKLLNVSVPALDIDPPPLIVTVPELGVYVPLFVNVPLTVKLVFPVTAPPLSVKLLNDRVVAKLNIFPEEDNVKLPPLKFNLYVDRK